MTALVYSLEVTGSLTFTGSPFKKHIIQQIHCASSTHNSEAGLNSSYATSMCDVKIIALAGAAFEQHLGQGWPIYTLPNSQKR